MIRSAVFAALLAYCLASLPGALAQPSDERVVIAYVPRANPVHTALYDELKEHQVLERVRHVLLPIRWPRTLRVELKGCDEANA